MKKATLLAGLISVAALPALADEFTLQAGDTLNRIISANVGKTVTLRTTSGQEFTGKVKMTTPTLVQLTQLTGRDYFDGVFPLDRIEAVIVRVK